MALQWAEASEDEIIQHCSRSNPDRNVISELQGGISVIRISEDAVVKCGFGVTHLEADNQQRAYNILSPKIIRIPRVYRFFARELNGYFIMEYINGQPISSQEDPDLYLEPMVKVLKDLEQVRRDEPGPLHKGPAFGQLWLDYDPIAPTTISDIEKYYNTRQLKELTRMSLTNYPLVLCHLDIAPRNILVLDDGSLCLIDWDSAGFYPRLFERVVIDINIREENGWNTKLLERLDELRDDEKSQARLLEKAYYLGQKYSFRAHTFIRPPHPKTIPNCETQKFIPLPTPKTVSPKE